MEFLRQVFKSFNVEKDLSAEDAVAGMQRNKEQALMTSGSITCTASRSLFLIHTLTHAHTFSRCRRIEGKDNKMTG
jgi:hypothetical protein